MTRKMPFILGVGGSVHDGSSTEQALALALRTAARSGAETYLFGGAKLAALPHYLTVRSSLGDQLVEAYRATDGVILASPGYHGSISGPLKNAIDYIEETAHDSRVYLDGVGVRLIATAAGWQATGTALSSLGSIVHALRGWPTPFGAGINTSAPVFEDGECGNDDVRRQLELVGRQVCEFALLRADLPGRRGGECSAAGKSPGSQSDNSGQE